MKVLFSIIGRHLEYEEALERCEDIVLRASNDDGPERACGQGFVDLDTVPLPTGDGSGAYLDQLREADILAVVTGSASERVLMQSAGDIQAFRLRERVEDVDLGFLDVRIDTGAPEGLVSQHIRRLLRNFAIVGEASVCAADRSGIRRELELGLQRIRTIMKKSTVITSLVQELRRPKTRRQIRLEMLLDKNLSGKD